MRARDLQFAIRGSRFEKRAAPTRASARGLFAFTLIEMIGALAVLAILASLLVPVVVRQIDQAAWNQEVTNLGAISNAVVLQALRNKMVSSTNSWASDAAAWLNMAPASIAKNARGYARAYLVDASGWLGNPTSYNPQTIYGTGPPVNARVLLLSTIAKDLPAVPDFNDVWNTPDRKVPNSWTNWGGRGEDLVIQRISLQPLFHRVILYNRDGPNGQAYFTIDTNAPTLRLEQAPYYLDAYYLDGSALGIGTYSGSNTNLLSTQVINGDMSRVFQGGTWTADIGPGPLASTSSNFQDIATAFVNLSPQAPGVVGVADALTTFMNAYSAWSSGCFPSTDLADSSLLNSVVDCFVGQSKNQLGPCSLVPSN